MNADHLAALIPTALMWGGYLIAGLFVAFNCFIIVGGDEVGLLERRWVGKQMPPGRVIAQRNEVGIQARVMGPGFHFLIPFIYKQDKAKFVSIPNDKVGVIESIDGEPIPAGRVFAKAVPGHNFFQDAEAFLRNGGEKGTQIGTLPPGSYRINPNLFKVTLFPQVVIKQNEIGLVTAQEGKSLPVGRLLATKVDGHNNFQDAEAFLANGGQKGPQLEILLPGTYYINLKLFQLKIGVATVVEATKIGLVNAQDGQQLPDNEFVAAPTPGHNNFQNAQAFLDNGGQKGPQQEVLNPGTYYINPLLFPVHVNEVTEVERGQVAVIISNVGKEPTEEMKANMNDQTDSDKDPKRTVYVVPNGYRGIQKEVLGPGRYYLNRSAYMPYIVSTTNITVDWAAGETFDPLSVTSKDGFELTVSVKVIIRVRPDQAPYMLAIVGSTENLIKNVIHPMIDSSFRNQASETDAMAFMQNRSEEQRKAEDKAKAELSKYHVELVSVLICQIILPQDLMDTQTKKVIAQQQTTQFQEQQKAEQQRIELVKTTETATQQKAIVSATIAVEVANQKKTETITLAEAASEKSRLEGEGQAASIAAVGKATAEAYEKQKQAIGSNAIMVIEALNRLKETNFPIVPQVMTVGGNGEAGMSSMISKFLLTQLQGTRE